MNGIFQSEAPLKQQEKANELQNNLENRCSMVPDKGRDSH